VALIRRHFLGDLNLSVTGTRFSLPECQISAGQHGRLCDVHGGEPSGWLMAHTTIITNKLTEKGTCKPPLKAQYVARILAATQVDASLKNVLSGQ